MPERVIRIPYVPTAKQSLLHSTDADEALYGGSAGGGKSEALLWEHFQTCMELPGVVTAIFRRTYPELEATLIRRSLQKFPDGCGRYSVDKKEWKFANGSILEFNHCEKESDVYKYQGAEWLLLSFDELTHFTEFQYEYLKSRVRTSIPGYRSRLGIKSASNPGNVGHGWVKSYFIDGRTPFEKFEVAVDLERATQFGLDTSLLRPTTRVFIPARVKDNPYLLENDPNYVVRLMSLPDKERRALLEGDWDVFEGQVFTEWRRDLHVVPPLESVPASWTKFTTTDHGFAQPFCTLWFAIEPDGHVLVYREAYDRLVPSHEQAKRLVVMSAGESLRQRLGDPAMWAQKDDKSIASIYEENGWRLTPANNSRIAGKMKVHEFLELDDDDRPWLQVTANCINLIRTLPQLVYDKFNVEDVNTNGEDHAYDCLRYGLMAVPRATRLEWRPKKY